MFHVSGLIKLPSYCIIGTIRPAAGFHTPLTIQTIDYIHSNIIGTRVIFSFFVSNIFYFRLIMI